MKRACSMWKKEKIKRISLFHHLCILFQQEIVLVEGSRVFESWKTPPPPVFMEFFFFNVTNADEFLKGAKPELIQIGPYTYR